MKKINLRHGDWLLKAIDSVPDNAKKAENKIKSKTTFRFATGEATNHHHEVTVKEPTHMEWFKDEFGNYYVNIKEEAIATHPEHSEKNDLVIPIGTYKVYQAEEVDWFSHTVRKVID